VLRVVERVGGGLVDRHGDRPGGRVGRVAGVDDKGFELHGGPWQVVMVGPWHCRATDSPCPAVRTRGYSARTMRPGLWVPGR
jgi:hypothetical protein